MTAGPVRFIRERHWARIARTPAPRIRLASMRYFIRALDRVLKGEATRPEALRAGSVEVPLGGLTFVLLLLGVFYGLCMGAYAVITRWGTPKAFMGWEQAAASAVKVPLLFFLTLLVTLPSLYVFNA